MASLFMLVFSRGSSSLRKFYRNLLLFALVMVMVDLLFGLACQYMNAHSRGGGVKSRYYVCKESFDDVLVFGSSRANHHYVPDIIEDSLGLKCYNTGVDGNGIIYCYGLLKMITERYSPKLIIYEVTEYFDIYKNDNMKYLDLLKPYYFEKGIDSIFWKVEPKTKYMMQSGLYRYNTTCLRIIGDYIMPSAERNSGYSPLFGIMDYEPVYNREVGEIDSLKLYFFEKFIQLARDKHISLVCCVSPIYKSYYERSCYQSVMDLCMKYDVPFLYMSDDEELSWNKEYFQDRIHMNDNGAREYTQKLMAHIKQLLKT